MNKYLLCWTRQCNMTCSMEVLLILLHIPFPVYEPSESKCFQVGCWLILAAYMEIFGSTLWVTTNMCHFTISPRSSVTNTQVIFFTRLSLSSSINNNSIFHNFGYFETAEISFTSNVSANTYSLLFTKINNMYMCKYYTACMGNHKYFSTDMLHITNTIHKPGQWNVRINPHSHWTMRKSKLCLVTV